MPYYFNKYRSSLGRLRFMQVMVVCAFLFLALAVFWRQWVSYDIYNSLNQKQCLRRILYPGMRGCIYDRNGQLLAGNRLRYQLVANLNSFRIPLVKLKKGKGSTPIEADCLWTLVNEQIEPYLKLIACKELDVSKKSLYRHYRQQALLPVVLLNNLSESSYATLVEHLPTEGPFQVTAENIRYYPYGNAACHVIGYVTQSPQLGQDSLPGADLKTFFLPRQSGKVGIEAYYDTYLRGLNGGDIWMVNPAGQEKKRLLSIPSAKGKDLYLTLDVGFQLACEKAMDNKTGAIVVMKVKTGEVLALVSKPDFDLNELTPRISRELFQRITESGAWLNRATQGLYPPGSTFKIISLAAMLRQKIINEASEVDCSGSYVIGKRPFHCHRRQGHGVINLRGAIRSSCNPFIYKYALRCGPTPIYEEAKRFCLDQPTHIHLPYESKNMLVPSPAWKKKRLFEPWTDGDTANLAIGQGFLRVTPLQMACFMASFAKGTTRTIPLLKKPEEPFNPEESTPIGLAEKDWSILVEGMELAVEEGSSHLSKIEGLRSAIKTGTSQIKISGENNFKHVGWVVGFTPCNDPDIAFALVVEQTDFVGSFWGGQVGGPMAKQILSYYLKSSFPP